MKDVKVSLKIYPKEKVKTKTSNWINTQDVKRFSLKIERSNVDDEEFKNVFDFMLSADYTALNRDTFIKYVDFDNMLAEQKMLNNNFNMVLI